MEFVIVVRPKKPMESVLDLRPCALFQSYFGLVVLSMSMNGVGFGFIYSTAIGKLKLYFEGM